MRSITNKCRFSFFFFSCWYTHLIFHSLSFGYFLFYFYYDFNSLFIEKLRSREQQKKQQKHPVASLLEALGLSRSGPKSQNHHLSTTGSWLSVITL